MAILIHGPIRDTLMVFDESQEQKTCGKPKRVPMYGDRRFYEDSRRDPQEITWDLQSLSLKP